MGRIGRGKEEKGSLRRKGKVKRREKGTDGTAGEKRKERKDKGREGTKGKERNGKRKE